MTPQEVTRVAHAYFQAHGDKAELEVAQKAAAAEDAGDKAEAENWRAVREAIRLARGANQG